VLRRRFRAVAVFVVAVATWTAIVIKWGEVAGLWVPDDPYDPGAVMAAEHGGTAIAAGVWLVGFIVIGLVGVWLNALIRQIRGD
jgi:hypothetical protein